MLISTQQELRILIPSHAVDSVEIFQGIIDNSEKDVLKDKLGAPLYDALCDYYNSLDPQEYFDSVTNGTYTDNPWSELLLNAQRIIVNDALARFAYQQVISINGTGVNVVSGNDYGAADDRLLERGVSGYRKEAAIAINNLLILLEEWAKEQPSSEASEEAPVPDASASGEKADGVSTPSSAIHEIVALWKQSKYYYLHADLLIPTASVLQRFLDIYENRDKFIRLLPDLRFIQDEYIEEAFGEELLAEMLEASKNEGGVTTSSPSTLRLLRKVRRLITAYLEQRTTVLSIDKTRRLQAHDEAISLKEQILVTLKAKEKAENVAEDSNQLPSPNNGEGSGVGSFKNNAQGSRIFVSPLLY